MQMKRHEEYSRLMPEGYRVGEDPGQRYYIIEESSGRTVTSRTLDQVLRWINKKRRPNIFASILRHALAVEAEKKKGSKK